MKGVQEQNCRSHCSFRLLHLLSPFPFSPGPIPAHHGPLPTSIFWPKPKPNATTHFPFLFFSFLSPIAHHFPLSSHMLPTSSNSHPTSYNQPLSTSFPSLSPFFSHANSHHPTCPSPSPFSSPCFLHEQPPKHPPHLLTMLSIHLCWLPLKDPSLGYKSHQEREEKGWSLSE